MQSSNAPSKLTLPFANAGQKNTIPVSSQIGNIPGAASYTDGFPPLTMQPVSAGGIPPSGLDFNGIFYALSAVNVWLNTGTGFSFDAGFAAAVGGYPLGARVLRADGAGYWRSAVENNTSNPDTGGAGWVPDGFKAIASVYASAQQTLTVGAAKVMLDTVEFDAHGLWDATHKRFVAPYAGLYRVAGTVLLASPGGQLLSGQVWKNGALAKQCAQFPQVSDGNIGYPLDAVISMAVGDYLEPYMSVSQSAVTAGIGGGGNNAPYVFAQVEYLGA